jgi:hypothetical protein
MKAVVDEIEGKVDQRLVALAKVFQQSERVAEYMGKIRGLENLVLQKKVAIRDLRKRISSVKDTSSHIKQIVSTVCLENASDIAKLSSKETARLHIDLKSISHLLSIRRMRLLQDLSELYRIDFAGKMRTIGGLILPPINILKRCEPNDEATVATALGYLAHRTQLASRILDFPLRYDLHLLGSKSTILDSQHEYPLFYKVSHFYEIRI